MSEVNGLIQNLTDAIETNLRSALMRAHMLPQQIYGVKIFKDQLQEMIDKSLEKLKDSLKTS